MKKTLSLQNHILISYYLKVANIATIKASTILANNDGKTKPAFLFLKKIISDLDQIRCDLDEQFYADHHQECDTRQRYLGRLDRKLKLIYSGKNIFL